MVFVFCLCSLTMFSVQISLLFSVLILISWFKNSTNFMRTSKQFINQSFVSTGNLHNYSSTGVYVVLTSRWVYFVSILKKQSSHCVSNWLEVFPQWYLFVVRWFFYQWLLFIFFHMLFHFYFCIFLFSFILWDLWSLFTTLSHDLQSYKKVRTYYVLIYNLKFALIFPSFLHAPTAVRVVILSLVLLFA